MRFTLARFEKNLTQWNLGTCLFSLLIVLSIGIGQTLAQQKTAGARDRGDAQNSGVYPSEPLLEPKGGMWKSDKLFTMVRSKVVSGGANWDYSRGNPPFTVAGVAQTASYSFYYLPPLVKDGVVYFSLYLGDAYFFAVDANSGKLKWKSTRKFDRYNSGTIEGNILYLASVDTLMAIDLPTQREMWSFHVGGGVGIRTSPLVVRDRIYLGSTIGYFYALDRETGAVKWLAVSTSSSRWDSAVFENGRVYCAENTGIIHAWDASSGKELWNFKSPKGVFAVILAGGNLYYVDHEGTLNAVTNPNGLPLATFHKVSKVGTRLAASDGKIFYSEEGSGGVFAINAATGERLWKFDGGSRCKEPAIAGSTVYVTCANQKIYGLDTKTGNKIWSKDSGENIMSAPVIADGAVYFVADDGRVHAIK